jgi:hypothetical protein
VFTYPPFVWNESLYPEPIDYHFKQLLGRDPIAGETIHITASCVELEDSTTVLDWVEDNGYDGNWYVDTISGLPMFLCGLSQVLFGYVPSRVWVRFKVKTGT